MTDARATRTRVTWTSRLVSAQRSQYLWMLGVAFCVSRILYFVVGVRFDNSALEQSWQLLPSDLLRHDLIRSLWYLHAQPPLFNAFVGVALHLPASEVLLAAAFVACGAAMTIFLFLLMLELAVPPPLAFVVTTLFMVSPSTVVYENWLFYTYPIAFFNVLLCWFFARYARTRRTSYAAGFGTTLMVIALTRASYHLAFVVAAGGLVVVIGGKARLRPTVVAITIPVLMVCGLYLKNYVVFGVPSASSWFGMNLAHMVLRNNPAQVRADIASGQLSPQAALPPFEGFEGHHIQSKDTGVPALDRRFKTGQIYNFNNINYIAISNQYLRDSLTFIRRHPDLYGRLVGDSFRYMFAPSTDYGGFQQRPVCRPDSSCTRAHKANYARLGFFIEVQNGMLGQVHTLSASSAAVPVARGAPGWLNEAWLVVAAYAATIAVGALAAARALRRRTISVAAATMVAVAVVVLYATLTSNLFEIPENMRFRFETDPLVCAGAAAVIAAAWRRWFQTRRTLPRSGAVMKGAFSRRGGG